MVLEISIRGVKTLVDVDYEEKIGIYGRDFWALIDDNKYESQTFDFIKRNFHPDKHFFDIGAATGCMSIYAAQLGYKVTALEPQNLVFEALQRNIALNGNLKTKIEAIHALVVATNSKFTEPITNFFTTGASGPLKNLDISANRVSIIELLAKVNNESKAVFKVDIEGAEFNILRDETLLEDLKSRRSVMYLSLHPGFLEPLRTGSKLGRLSWLLRAITEVVMLYSKLRKYSEIFNHQGTTRLNLVKILLHLNRDSRDFEVRFK